MPELPEVETIVRSLAPHVEGRRILEATFFTPRSFRGEIPPLAGCLVRRVSRHGKYVVLELDRGMLFVHLRMTGALVLREAVGPYTRALFRLDGGTLCFDDIRQFGHVQWREAAPDGLGPDPLEITPEEFRLRLRGRRMRIKPLLLDQGFLRGLGNIYVDEALFRAGVHPLTSSTRIGGRRAARLHQAIGEILRLAIKHRGSSISDYVDGQGLRGGFQLLHQVYGKEGQPCPGCGARIRRIVVGQRGTHYCPSCQKA